MPAPYFDRDYPTRTIDCLSHVGTLQPEHKRTGSYEGAGLSVSLHPDAWCHIAKLGGLPTWQLRRPGGRFLEAHALSTLHRETIFCWALTRGLVERCPVYVVQRFDEELDGPIVLTFDTLASAEAENDGDFTMPIHQQLSYRSTPALDQAARQESPTLGDRAVFDLLLPIFVEEELSLDGVWWDDILEPSCYSAPRGVIVPSKLPQWSRDQVVSHNLTRCQKVMP